MRTPALFGAKYYGFFKIYGVSARTRASADILQSGWAIADILQTRREGSICRDFTRTSFIDGPIQYRKNNCKILLCYVCVTWIDKRKKLF